MMDHSEYLREQLDAYKGIKFCMGYTAICSVLAKCGALLQKWVGLGALLKKWVVRGEMGDA